MLQGEACENNFPQTTVHDPYRLQLWLMALCLNLTSSVESPRSVQVPSELFSPEDYCPNETNEKQANFHSCADCVTTNNRGTYFIDLSHIYRYFSQKQKLQH